MVAVVVLVMGGSGNAMLVPESADREQEDKANNNSNNTHLIPHGCLPATTSRRPNTHHKSFV